MSRFLRECVSDPALGVVVAIAVIIVVVMTWLVIKDKVKQRRVNQRLHRKRDEIKEKQAKAIHEPQGQK
jgi:sensor domain CHASE-containing protein